MIRAGSSLRVRCEGDQCRVLDADLHVIAVTLYNMMAVQGSRE